MLEPDGVRANVGIRHRWEPARRKSGTGNPVLGTRNARVPWFAESRKGLSNHVFE